MFSATNKNVQPKQTLNFDDLERQLESEDVSEREQDETPKNRKSPF